MLGFSGGASDTAPSSDAVFIARQPIFDSRQRLFAYELLYRSSFTNVYDGNDGTEATLTVLRNAFLVLGPRLIGSRKAFVNFNADLIRRRLPLMLNSARTVIEILEDVEVDQTIRDRCVELRTAGYTIALDDFGLKNGKTMALVDIAAIVKVDFRQTNVDERREILHAPWARKIEFLAEKVETHEEFREALNAGYLYFQGYFFGKPVIVSAKDISSSKVNYVRMLSEINRDEIDLPNLERIVKGDTYFSYALLNYINSAYFGLRDNVGSIMQALALLGEREVRKWASLVVLTFLGADKPSEVIVTSLIRARFCEDLAAKTGMAGKAQELFLTGMFSMLDVLVGRPIEETLDTINVSKDIRTALTGGANRHANILGIVLAYERAAWSEVDRLAGELDLDVFRIPSVYSESVKWVEQIFDSEAGRSLRERQPRPGTNSVPIRKSS